ncbi:heavy metal response regulator transcription factor [Bordetella avium]|uniref:heavy metal response regulator transcription factor n=1 Tax=Bordetella avium TaxID=521 RepID=UPI000318BADA|nr:heavy metal response regulator transcription factor [Bordetella avium]AZY49370.1 DNA-binding response regulator [Bordetella avium]AZY52723.1 DNA-binding response regulator [Bordetella avium]RIQ12848.1 DNA-binding response regulator [Bordetella avium]RIQ19117.1 DNA-binding response regulator [Bordetella avium]RIQ32028.1 DNA-binding response regulator [Bordetella avium]
MRILIVEDEPKTADYLAGGLAESGYAVTVARDGRSAQHCFESALFDLVLLDVMLPGMDGWEVLRVIRRRASTPVLFLSARDSVQDRVKGLELGGDDYLIKPFSYAELLARVRSLLRRGPVQCQDVLRLGDLEMVVGRFEVRRAGRLIRLTAKEFVLLRLLLERQGEVLTRTMIASHVWLMNFDCDTNVVDVAIRRLRMKIDEPYPDRLIHTVRGMGYRLALCE